MIPNRREYVNATKGVGSIPSYSGVPYISTNIEKGLANHPFFNLVGGESRLSLWAGLTSISTSFKFENDSFNFGTSSSTTKPVMENLSPRPSTYFLASKVWFINSSSALMSAKLSIHSAFKASITSFTCCSCLRSLSISSCSDSFA